MEKYLNHFSFSRETWFGLPGNPYATAAHLRQSRELEFANVSSRPCQIEIAISDDRDLT
jgi:hypothetical protein